MSATEEWSEAIAHVSNQLDDVRRDYAKEAEKRDRRIRTNRLLTYATIVAAGIAIWVGVDGIRSQDRTNRNIEVARVSSCVQYNRHEDAQAAAEKREIRTLFSAVAPTKTLTAAQQLKIVTVLGKYDTTVTAAHVHRDCSTEGIRKYLSRPST